MPRPRAIVFAAVIAALLAAIWLLLRTREETLPLTLEPTTDTKAEQDNSPTDAVELSAARAAVGEQRREVAQPPLPETTSGTLRVLVQWPPETPAAGVQIYVREAERGSAYSILAHGLTSAEGIVTFADLPRGKTTLLADRGDRLEIDVVGGPQEVQFVLQEGVLVHGSVTTPDGASVGGATIWLQASRTDWSACTPIATSDANGAFVVQHAGKGQSLGATAANYAPSKLVDLDTVDTTKPPAIVALQLQPNGGQLTGTVTDREDHPIANALVAAGKQPRHLDHRGREAIEAWTPRVARTDENGHFAMEGLGSGTVPVAVRAAGFGIWRASVEISNGASTTIQPRLLGSSRIAGTVTDGDGKPLANARLSFYDQPPGTSFLSGGQIDFDETFGYVCARSDAHGRFLATGVTPGKIHAYAQRGGRLPPGVSVAYTFRELEVAPDSTAEWNPTLTDGHTIEGVVLHRDGQPMGDVFLTLTDERSNQQHVQTNDTQGQFRFLCLENSTYLLHVQYWDAPAGTPPLEQKGIVPDRGRIELRATYDKPIEQKPGRVTGRIDDVGGRITNLAAVTVTLETKRGSWPGGKIENGTFRFERVDPCDFCIVLKQDQTTLATSEWFTLAPAGSVDTGALRTVPGGAARIIVARAEGTQACEPKLYLSTNEARGSSVFELGRASELMATNLTPGTYTISGYATGVLPLKGKFTVQAGETTEVQLDMRVGALSRFAVWFRENSKPTLCTYRIVASDGTEFQKRDVKTEGMPMTPYPIVTTVPPGEWTIEITTDDGQSGSLRFQATIAEDPPSLRVDMK